MTQRNTCGATGVAPTAETGQKDWSAEPCGRFAEDQLHRESLTAADKIRMNYRT